MKRALCLAILLPLVALAGSKDDFLKARTILNDGQYAGNTAPVYAVPHVTPGGPSPATWYVGRIDTVGGTTYDVQGSGPGDQYIYCDTCYGVHVIWLFSADSASPFTDRNMHYNFYDFTAGAWNFGDRLRLRLLHSGSVQHQPDGRQGRGTWRRHLHRVRRHAGCRRLPMAVYVPDFVRAGSLRPVRRRYDVRDIRVRRQSVVHVVYAGGIQ
jgi:hypothetical protein